MARKRQTNKVEHGRYVLSVLPLANQVKGVTSPCYTIEVASWGIHVYARS